MSQSTFSARQLILVVLFAMSALLGACGGGGGSSTPATPVTPVTPVTPTPPAGTIVSPMGCGNVTSTGTGNTTPIVIDAFPCAVAGGAGQVNVPQQPYISVKICKPGSTTVCQIIDHVILDTGSSGLRIAASALSSALQPGPAGLPLVATNGGATTLTECETYVASFAYGPVVKVDVVIAGESAPGATMQVFGDANFPVPTTGCSSLGGTATNTVQTFGGNGLLGVSFAPFDTATPYFDCAPTTGTNCQPNTTFVGIPNIVTLFGTDNNGVSITLPAISATGATAPVSGTLTFGISTNANNTPASTVLALVNDGNASNTTYGTFAAQVSGAPTWTPTYIDSGTDAVYFNDPSNTSLTACSSSNYSSWYCPASAQNVAFNLANFGNTTTLKTVTLSVVSPTSLSSNAIAYSNLAGPVTSSSAITAENAFGLATFFGHTNYILFGGATATTFGGSTPLTGPVNGIQ